MKRISSALLMLVALALAGGCGHGPVRASGSTAYFFAQLQYADASADYITLPTSLADTLPNRTYRSASVLSTGKPVTLTWTERVVLGRVAAVHQADQNRLRLTIEVEESFPATRRDTLDVLVAGGHQDRDRYAASAASLGRVVVGLDSYRDDDGRTQVVVAMASQLIGVVEGDRIRYPLLTRDDFKSAQWDRDMTTLAGLRAEAAAAPTTIIFGRG